jgi:hypothetical protein
MIRNKMTMSIVAFSASVLLFIGVTFAWLTFQTWVTPGEQTYVVVNIDADSAGLEISNDGVTYDTVESIAAQNKVPGDIVFYRLNLSNSGNTPIDIRVSFVGFLLFVNDELKNSTNFLPENHLMYALLLSGFNDVNNDILEPTLLVDLVENLPLDNDFTNSRIVLFESITLAIGQSVNITFALQMSTSAGNQYQNLKLSIDSIVVDAVFE